MNGNGEKKIQKVLEGIQYLVGDNKQVREDLMEFAKSAEEDRRRADEYRRRSDERFERLMEKSDERFNVVVDQVKRTNRVAVEIARDLRQQQKLMLEKQDESNRLLHAILKRLPPGTNGK